jgi:pimeloyl-ACP methyl ester carboxylesterase
MIEFRIKENDILMGVYLNGSKGNIVYAPGMPQTLDKYHPFVLQMERLGYNLFIPRYMGTYESDGKFSTENSVRTLETIIDIVNNGRGIELFAGKELSWAPSPTYLIGFSYGALPALLQNKPVVKTILVCPFVSMDFHNNGGAGENVKETYEFLERAYPNIYRFKAKDAINDMLNIKLPESKQAVIVLRGSTDGSIPDEEIELLAKKYNAEIIIKDGGHSISIPDNILAGVLM